MTDYPTALAAARECLDNEGHRATDALRDLLAALDAAHWGACADELDAIGDRGTEPPAPQPAAAVPGGYNEDEIADACMMAEVSDSKYVAIIAYLGDNRRAMLAANKENGND